MKDRRKALRSSALAGGWLAAVDVPHAVMRTDIDQYGRDGRTVTIKWSRNNRVLDVLVDGQRPLNDPQNGDFGLKYRGIDGAIDALFPDEP